MWYVGRSDSTSVDRRRGNWRVDAMTGLATGVQARCIMHENMQRQVTGVQQPFDGLALDRPPFNTSAMYAKTHLCPIACNVRNADHSAPALWFADREMPLAVECAGRTMKAWRAEMKLMKWNARNRMATPGKTQ